MSKALLGSVFSICISLVVATAWILSTPIPSFAAAECTATCAGGYTVTCNGYSCEAKDGTGCYAEDKMGNGYFKSCLDKGEVFIPEEGAS